jgi:hypothetical protein
VAPATDRQALGPEPTEAALARVEEPLERPRTEAVARRRLTRPLGRRMVEPPEGGAAARATRQPEAAAALPAPTERRCRSTTA